MICGTVLCVAAWWVAALYLLPSLVAPDCDGDETSAVREQAVAPAALVTPSQHAVTLQQLQAAAEIAVQQTRQSSFLSFDQGPSKLRALRGLDSVAVLAPVPWKYPASSLATQPWPRPSVLLQTPFQRPASCAVWPRGV